MNLFTESLGVQIPIIQAPTSAIAGPELAAAVCSAGALGGMGLTWTAPAAAAQRVRQVRAATRKPFLVNFVLAFPPTALAAALDAGAPIVSFSFGNPEPYLAQIRTAGAKVGVQVGNADGARCARRLGVDFVICQGSEAGGHVQSSTPLAMLLPAVLDAVGGDLPVAAAGGLATGADIAGVLRQGASAAMLGTRFVATQESGAHPDYKRRLLEAGSGQTALTICFDGGWPSALHRVLRNSTLENWEAVGSPPPGRRPGEGNEVARDQAGNAIRRYDDSAPRAGMTGAIADMALYAGTGVEQVTDLPRAGELVQRLWQAAQYCWGA
jgi:NAD(P)H-dependent flavin oxidoreductase YrpB (nitropropane dioxygenase family)